MNTKPNGYILYETAFLVAIATGFHRKSENPKTGAMVQIWILNRNTHPVQAQRLGKDKVVCGDCPLRPANAVPGEARCYVNTGQAPAQVYRKYRAGKYPKLKSTGVFSGKPVRFGAYGNPSKLPLPLVADIAGKASRHTGYTHQWRNSLLAGYRQFLMASADDVDSQLKAVAQGWRTFRVAPKGSSFQLKDEVSCPASKESGHRTTCAKCGLCSGNAIKAKNVVIQAH